MAAALAALALGTAGVATSSATVAGAMSCGQVRAAGKTWIVVHVGAVRCSTAKSVARRVAGVRASPTGVVRTFSGFTCRIIQVGNKTSASCLNASHRTLLIGNR